MDETQNTGPPRRRRYASQRWHGNPQPVQCRAAPPPPPPPPPPKKKQPEPAPRQQDAFELAEPVLNPPLRESVPFQAIVTAYHERMRGNPRVRVLSETTKRSVRARWNEDVERQDLSWWQQYFDYCAKCGLLTGNNERGWRADFQWLVLPTNMEKVINGRYQ